MLGRFVLRLIEAVSFPLKCWVDFKCWVDYRSHLDIRLGFLDHSRLLGG